MDECVLYYLVTAIILGFGFGMFYIADVKAAKRRQNYLDSTKKRIDECEAAISSNFKKLNEMRESISLKPVQVQKPSVKRFGNCPNCGAPITGDSCEYCGTVFVEEIENSTTLYADNRPILTLYNDISHLQDRITTEEMYASLIKSFNDI